MTRGWRRGLRAAGVVLAAAVALWTGRSWREVGPGGASTPGPAPRNGAGDATPDPRAAIGFRSLRALDEHFEKHGREFGVITRDEYLRRAQALRDAPAGGSVIEIHRSDGVISRFDRRTGAFAAFNRDLTLRTFFRPGDGEAYFRRQAERER